MKAQKHFRVMGVLVLTAAGYVTFACPAVEGAGKPNEKLLAQGRELFMREWLPGDKRSHAGDGLGPLFNGNSCMECHHQGGAGGAGPNGANVTLLSAFIERQQEQESVSLLAWLFGAKPKPKPKKEPPPQLDRAKLAELHPGFQTNNSVPFHRFATGDEYAKWKKKYFSFAVGPEIGDIDDAEVVQVALRGSRKALGKVTVLFVPSQRNTPAL